MRAHTLACASTVCSQTLGGDICTSAARTASVRQRQKLTRCLQRMHVQALARAPARDGPVEWPAFVLDPPPQRRNRSSLLPEREPLPAGVLWGSFTPSPPPIPLSSAVSPSVGPAGPSTSAGGSERKAWVVVLLIVLICATLLCAAAALWWFLVLQRRRQRAVAAKVEAEATAQHDGWRTTQAAAGSAPVRHLTNAFLGGTTMQFQRKQYRNPARESSRGRCCSPA